MLCNAKWKMSGLWLWLGLVFWGGSFNENEVLRVKGSFQSVQQFNPTTVSGIKLVIYLFNI